MSFLRISSASHTACRSLNSCTPISRRETHTDDRKQWRINKNIPLNSTEILFVVTCVVTSAFRQSHPAVGRRALASWSARFIRVLPVKLRICSGVWLREESQRLLRVLQTEAFIQLCCQIRNNIFNWKKTTHKSDDSTFVGNTAYVTLLSTLKNSCNIFRSSVFWQKQTVVFQRRHHNDPKITCEQM